MADQIDIDNLVNQLREATVAMNRLGGTAATGSTGSKDINRLVQALARLGEKFDRTAKSQTQRDQDIQGFIDEVDSAAKSIEDLDAAAREQARAAADLAAELDKAARRANLSSEQLAAEESRDRKAARNKQARAELEQLRAKQAKEVNYSALLARARLDEIAQTKTLQARLENLGDTITDRFGTDAVKTQVAMIRLQGAIKKVQESARELGSAFVRGVGDIVMSTASLATDIGDGAKSFTQFNGLIDSVTNALGEMAKAIPFAGEAISGAMKLTAEGAKFVLDQLQKTADSFNELGSVGALTAGGLTELRKAQFETGVSLDVYKKAIAENSTTLAKFGGTVGSGTQRFTKVLTPLTKQGSETSAELRRLGFTLGDISEATGGYLSIQTKLGRSQSKSNAELTRGAAEYAKELDILAKLTGKSRKEIQDQQEQALTEGRFRATYDQMIASGQEKQAKAMMDFTTLVQSADAPEMAAGLRDLAAGLGPTSEAARKLFTDTGGEAQRIMDRLKSGQIDQVQAYRQLQAAIRGNIKPAQTLASAVGDEQDVFTKYAEKSNFLNSQITDLGQVVSEQKNQMTKGTDPLTDSTVKAQQEMEIFSIQIQEIGMNAMPKATKAIEAFTTVLNKFVGEISDKLGIEGLTSDQPRGPDGQPIADKDKLRFRDLSEVDPSKDFTQADRDQLNQKKAELKLLEKELYATTTYEDRKAVEELMEQVRAEAKILEDKEKYELEYRKQERKRIEAEKKKAELAAKRAAVGERVQAELDKQRAATGGSAAGAPGAAAQPAGGAGGGQPPTVRSGGGGPPTGAITPDQLFNFGSGTGSQAHFEKLDPGFRQALVSMAQEYNLQTGQKLNLNSAFRSIEEQASINPGANPKAQPGRSKHNFGMAADLNSNEVRALAQMGLLSKYGFKTLANDPPHIYMRDGGVIPARQGGTRVVAGEAGQNEAFVPLPDGRRIPVVLENFNIQDLVAAIKGATKGAGAQDARKTDISRSIVDAITPLTQSFEQAMAETTNPINSMVTKLQAVTQGAVRTPGSGAGVMDTGAMLGAATQQLSVEEKITKLKERARSTEEAARIGAANDANMRLTTEQKLEKLKSRARSTEEGARIGARNDANIQLTTEQKFGKLREASATTLMPTAAPAMHADFMPSFDQDILGADFLQSSFDDINQRVKILAPRADDLDSDALAADSVINAFQSINGRVKNLMPQAADLGEDMLGKDFLQSTFEDINGQVKRMAPKSSDFDSDMLGADFIGSAFQDINAQIRTATRSASSVEIEDLDTEFIDSAFKDINQQVQAVDLDGAAMMGEMLSRPMDLLADVTTAGLSGMPENPNTMTAMSAPGASSLIGPNVASALTDIENVFAKAGMTPGSTPPTAAAAPALGAAPEMAAGGMAEMMSQLSKLVDLQSRSNKISEKLVRVSTN